MKIFGDTYSLFLRVLGVVMWTLPVASCIDNIHPEEIEDITGQMVMFSAGNAENLTKASIPYMEQDGRFVCRMYYHAKANDTDTSEYDVEKPENGGSRLTAWLKVNNKVGNSVYWNSSYSDVPSEQLDPVYGWEKAAPAFYWQNRLTHAFLALADYNQLKTNTGSASLSMPDNDYIKEVETDGVKKHETPVDYQLDDMTLLGPGGYAAIEPTSGGHTPGSFDDEPHNGQEFQDTDGYFYRWTRWLLLYVDENTTATFRIKYRVTAEKVKMKYYARTYDLTKGDKTSMSQQPDPIQALTLKKPDGTTQEANRVSLYFKHQFSQIQVNLKKSSDAGDIAVEPGNIQSVELVGISPKGYVYVELNPEGTVHPADYLQVSQKTLPGGQDMPYVDWENNPYGTSFSMFDRDLSTTEQDMGYIKSYEAIAFGRLEGIRIRWKESETNVEHNVLFQIPNEALKTLESGYRYIYNLELRRGTLALVRTVIKNWEVDEEEYNTSGTITN